MGAGTALQRRSSTKATSPALAAPTTEDELLALRDTGRHAYRTPTDGDT
ncbi:hypothetical protein [Streptomyces nigrescens]|nr:hypothetical protein [Streptomyces nigrescens]